MLSASQLRNNTIFVYQGEPCRVQSYQHTHMGRGSADVRVRIKNLISGTVLSCCFSPEDRFEEASLVKKRWQCLYQDDTSLYLMDKRSYQQISLPLSLVGEQAAYLQEGADLAVISWEDRPIGVELPQTMEFTVIEADPGARGNSTVNIYKNAVIAPGHTVKVPLFINQGDKIVVNTVTGEYVKKAKS